MNRNYASIVVAVDTSLSTRGDQKLELESARRFAHAILRPIDGLSLFQFSEIVDQLTPFTADLHTIDKAINQVDSGRRRLRMTPSISGPTRCRRGAGGNSWW